VITRILPQEEWPRLNGTEAETLWPLLDPENARVLAVEEDGKIVGTWTLMRAVHAECIWIAPSHRGVFGVAKRLLRAMREVVTEWGTDRVITGSIDPHVTDLIVRLGGFPLPCQSFILPTERVKEREMEGVCPR